ncbi:MAG: 3-mercaptopyruvate sulfurtransferase [Rhodospirillaceae bacterium]|nr:3-mercaptopyruvate sulfurtransferase [Rhodospirillaceae bacterium]
MSYTKPEALLSTEWLAANLDDPKVVVVDASLPRVGVKEDTRANYRDAHIPGAPFFDIDVIADPNASLPHMMPTAEIFAEGVCKLGISNDTKVVIYDQHGIYSAPRAWWMFRAFGHDNVGVLDGGLPKWRSDGYPVASDTVVPSLAEFSANVRPELLRLVEQVNANISSGGEQVIDARGAGRYNGTETETRAGLRSGHIPGSLNVPYANIVKDGSMVDSTALRHAFEAGGVDFAKPITTSCGSGITACILALGLYLEGRDDVAIYDGSWTEWGGREDLPIET